MYKYSTFIEDGDNDIQLLSRAGLSMGNASNGLKVFGTVRKLSLAKKAFPPGWFITVSLYYEGVFTLSAAPDFVLLVIIGIGATTTRAGCSYFLGCFLVELLPVVVTPAGTDGHINLLVKCAVLLYHHRQEHGPA